MAKLARRFMVSGRVQGVFYRASSRSEALRLGLVGYAKNLTDGRVEVLAHGESEALALFAKWLWQGPPAAAVTSVVELEVLLDESLPTGFSTH